MFETEPTNSLYWIQSTSAMLFRMRRWFGNFSCCPRCMKYIFAVLLIPVLSQSSMQGYIHDDGLTVVIFS